jgi:molybdopterin-guanine dinucleotide biosynthesis protein A
LELVIRAFQDGATAETIAQRYPTATLAEIYTVIAYYLRHRGEIEAYLAEREQRAKEVRQRIESHQVDLADLRTRLFARQRSA